MGFIGRAVAPSPISANDVPDLPASKLQQELSQMQDYLLQVLLNTHNQ